MNRQSFLKSLALGAGGLLVGDEALALFERLTHRKVFALGAIPPRSVYLRLSQWQEVRFATAVGMGALLPPMRAGHVGRDPWSAARDRIGNLRGTTFASAGPFPRMEASEGDEQSRAALQALREQVAHFSRAKPFHERRAIESASEHFMQHEAFYNPQSRLIHHTISTLYGEASDE